MIGGYVEQPDKQRAGTNEAWAFDRANGGSWSLVPYADGPKPGVSAGAQYACMHAAWRPRAWMRLAPWHELVSARPLR